jgi:hypothetical protein
MRRRLLERALVDLQRRIGRLEQLGSPALIPGLVWIETLDPEERNAMSPDDRIVEDFYLNEKSGSVMICERITNNLSDVGKEFPDGSWDRSRLPSTNAPPKRLVWRARPVPSGVRHPAGCLESVVEST